ncbi:AAA family ATPase [Microvirga zambiensis]|uniref:AAA family ATPase n=1 Tax=Microvirga zambiensis TaxID=1402137 RepID=UPI00191DE5D1|nr:AAA family ATPase [Microvirga zambiensis]
MTQALSASVIATALGKARRKNNYFTCCCPAHNDRHPSFTISDTDDGGIRFKCFTGCTREQIKAALEARGLWPNARDSARHDTFRPLQENSDKQYIALSPLPPDTPNPFVAMMDQGLIDSCYFYFDQDGRGLGAVTRKNKPSGKQILPYIYVEYESGERQWIPGSFPKPWPLYGLRELTHRPNAPVLIVEGEKSADAVHKHILSHVPIAWPGGSSAVDQIDWSPLRGRDIILWPDADRAGRGAMEKVRAQAIAAGAQSVRCVQLPPHLPEGWDLADEIPDGLDVQQLLREAADVGGRLRRHIQSAREVSVLNLPPKSYLVDNWLPRGGLAMVWAARGLGKTWFCLELAVCVAEGDDFLAYGIPSPETVLYVDGEMPLVDIKERLNQLRSELPENLHILSSERLFANDTPLNINDEADQQRIIDAVEDMTREGIRPSLIILDNLSSLAAGLDENDNSALDRILKFLRQLRHGGVTVLLVHHANKTGDQRGASRREDLLDTSIKLVLPTKDQAAPHDGGHFVMEFTKTRGRTPKPSKLEIKLVPKPGGLVGLSWCQDRVISPLDHILRVIAKERPRTQAELVAKLGRVKSTISKDCTKLEKQGLITRQPIALTPNGRKRALDVFPDLYSILAEQDDVPF